MYKGVDEVSRATFVDYVKQKVPVQMQETLITNYDMFDKDKNGDLSIDELLPALVYTLKQLKKLDIEEKAQQEEQLDQFSDFDQTARLTQLIVQLQAINGQPPDKIFQVVAKSL